MLIRFYDVFFQSQFTLALFCIRFLMLVRFVLGYELDRDVFWGFRDRGQIDCFINKFDVMLGRYVFQRSGEFRVGFGVWGRVEFDGVIWESFRRRDFRVGFGRGCVEKGYLGQGGQGQQRYSSWKMQSVRSGKYRGRVWREMILVSVGFGLRSWVQQSQRGDIVGYRVGLWVGGFGCFRRKMEIFRETLQGMF